MYLAQIVMDLFFSVYICFYVDELLFCCYWEANKAVKQGVDRLSMAMEERW